MSVCASVFASPSPFRFPFRLRVFRMSSVVIVTRGFPLSFYHALFCCVQVVGFGLIRLACEEAASASNVGDSVKLGRGKKMEVNANSARQVELQSAPHLFDVL